ncbi:MAG: NAD(P)/FAD-dependent oxidoreductase [Kofleriaceae bacterium]|nr:NAD(P)/FAD-dependent oxidoreductase [Kofleriaceae bacterium]MCL4223664.1 NAD(P)/FAD-dependent oxidoreductase [Myxococcales bacterium]
MVSGRILSSPPPDAPRPRPGAAPDPAAGPFDDLVIGAGMAGLTVAALLARDGRRVLVVEAHDTPGGYAHTFGVGAYRFCAQVHYIFACGEGETVHEVLRRLELDDTVGAIGRELDRLPPRLGWRELATAPLRLPHLLRYRTWTLQRLYDRLRMPQRLQAVLAGQAGDYLLPPAEVSLLLHVALVRGYDRGAYYPERHFQHLVGSLADRVRGGAGCQLLLSTPIDRILVDGDRVTGVRARDGRVFTARRYVSNVDPRRTAAMMDRHRLPGDWQRRLAYAYSSGNLTLYLGVAGLDLRQHGFGSHNVWHYPHDDLNAIYRRQLVDLDFDEPWLFMSTPTLHTDEPGLCPPGHQILELATSAPHAHFRHLRDTDRRRYNLEKKRLRDRMLAIVEDRYVPGLRRHLVMRVMGTPATNERFCGAPEGNAYGAALTPATVGLGRVPAETPFRNLWLANATAGYPSVAGTVRAGLDLYRTLS